MKLPKQLAYQKSTDPTDVIFEAVWPSGEIEPLKVHSRINLGQKDGSHWAYNDDGTIKDKIQPTALAEGNPHQLDFCQVPYGATIVQCSFSITISSELLEEYKCSDLQVSQTVHDLVELYIEKVGLEEIVSRFLANIFNGRWLWENKKTYFTTIEVQPWPWTGKQIIAEDIRLQKKNEHWLEEIEGWKQLVNLVCESMKTADNYCILEVYAKLKLPRMARIYPSQEFKESTKKLSSNKEPSGHKKARIYQSTEIDGIKSPIFGCYKTGAAIATIDDWYPNAEKPLRVGHYGVDKQHATAYRHPDTGKDFFSLLKRADEFVKILKENDVIDAETIKDLHFIMANLIKGGLFQEKGN
ncbi:TPA: type I-F CRISPR-associated protein Csy3 [Vibrio parahaemolyticus]|nr:type I-F CRISPR-associated protein Csy3 [Vibrio parahaemolyticus]